MPYMGFGCCCGGLCAGAVGIWRMPSMRGLIASVRVWPGFSRLVGRRPTAARCRSQQLG